jgi:hypothetical protein
METKAETEERLKRRVKFTGYGILLTVPPPGQPYTVRAAQGSPAEADGLASDQLQTLVAINGVVLKTRPDYPPLLPKNWSHELPPLKLTLVSDAGKAHTVTLKHTGEYYMGGEKLILPNDKRVALLFASAGSSFAIAERAGQPSGGTSTYLNGSWADSVNGTAATFYGSIRHPDADFSKGGIDYEITNDKGDLNQRQIKQIIRGL